MTQEPRIVLLGGGTGSFTLLQGLKTLTSNLTAIVSMSDDGGSTGVLRDELGVLPPGDVRQCLVALSDLPEIRDLFSYRFDKGRLQGQSLGNIILSGLELQYGNFEDAIRIAGELLRIHGSVIPVTLQKHTLVAKDEGWMHRGQHLIDTSLRLTPETEVYLDPPAQLNPPAQTAILAADLVVIAPGSLHTSLLPILAVSDMPATLAETKAVVVSVANLINKPLQTPRWHVVDYIKQLERQLGAGVIDVVLYNNEPVAPALLTKYAADGELPVDITPSRFAEIRAQAIGARLIAEDMVAQDPADTVIRRTLIRHDSRAVVKQLRNLIT
ncbi:MAG TPA: gluconeogenesis factor YvcK family protein [Verrucomicrobiae bacterium]|nr:gluconeogenesis factor YvcK family protein [Verrucomicrobiae bacterium]